MRFHPRSVLMARKLVRALSIDSAVAGWNRVFWNGRYDLSPGVTTRLLPGTYTLRLTQGKAIQSQNFTFEDDPKVTTSLKDRKALRSFLEENANTYKEANKISSTLSAMRTSPL